MTIDIETKRFWIHHLSRCAARRLGRQFLANMHIPMNITYFLIAGGAINYDMESFHVICFFDFQSFRTPKKSVATIFYTSIVCIKRRKLKQKSNFVRFYFETIPKTNTTEFNAQFIVNLVWCFKITRLVLNCSYLFVPSPTQSLSLSAICCPHPLQ